MSALVPGHRAGRQAARLFLVSDGRAQGILSGISLRSAVTAGFAAVTMFAVYRATANELALPGGPRPVFLAGASVALICLLLGNGIAAGGLSRTTGVGHEQAMRSLPVPARTVAAFSVLMCLVRGATFAVGFLAPAAAAGIVHASSPGRVALVALSLLVLPVLPAVTAGVLVRRGASGASGVFVLLAICGLSTGRLLAGQQVNDPLGSVIKVLALPARALIGEAQPTEFLGLASVWLAVTSILLMRLTAGGATMAAADGGPAYPGRRLLRAVLRLRSNPTLTLSAITGGRLSGSVIVVLTIVASMLSMVYGRAVADWSAKPGTGVEPGAAVLVATAAMSSGLVYLVASALARSTVPPEEESRALATMPLSATARTVAACLPVVLAAVLSGVVPVPVFVLAAGLPPGTAVGLAAVLWLGACIAIVPLVVGAANARRGRISRGIHQCVVVGLVGARVVVVAVTAVVGGSVPACLIAALVADALGSLAGIAYLLHRRAGGKL